MAVEQVKAPPTDALKSIPRLSRSKHGRSGWSYRIDGEPIQSVTKIINEGVPKPALQSWYANEVAKCVVSRRRQVLEGMTDDEVYDFLRGAPGRAMRSAGDRGTEIHRLAERLVAGEAVQPPPEIAAQVELYADFLEAFEIRDALLERPCFHLGLGYGGTFDMIATSPFLNRYTGSPVGRALWDIKSSGSGIYGEVALQLSGYERAEVYVDEAGEIRDMEPVDGCYVVWVTPEGYDVFQIATTEQEWLTFRAAARVAWWRQARMDRVVGDSMWSGQVVKG